MSDVNAAEVLEDELAEVLKSEPPLAAQVLALGQYMLQLVSMVHSLAASLDRLTDDLAAVQEDIDGLLDKSGRGDDG